MFAMEKLLSGFDVRVAAFEVCDVRSGWCLDMVPADELALHYVLAGQGTIRIGESAPMPLAPATVVVVPPGHRRVFTAGRPNGGEPVPVAPSDGCCAPLTQGLVRRDAGDEKPAKPAGGATTRPPS